MRINHLLIVAENNTLSKTQKQRLKHRAPICGSCDFLSFASTVKVTGNKIPVYKCGACGCDPTIDIKMLLKNDKCIKNKW